MAVGCRHARRQPRYPRPATRPGRACRPRGGGAFRRRDAPRHAGRCRVDGGRGTVPASPPSLAAAAGGTRGRAHRRRADRLAPLDAWPDRYMARTAGRTSSPPREPMRPRGATTAAAAPEAIRPRWRLTNTDGDRWCLVARHFAIGLSWRGSAPRPRRCAPVGNRGSWNAIPPSCPRYRATRPLPA
jgi:hypothetical protein